MWTGMTIPIVGKFISLTVVALYFRFFVRNFPRIGAILTGPIHSNFINCTNFTIGAFSSRNFPLWTGLTFTFPGKFNLWTGYAMCSCFFVRNLPRFRTTLTKTIVSKFI